MSKSLSGAGLALAAITVLSQPAQPAEPRFNWTGFYAGANAGYGWGRSKTDDTFSNADPSPAPLGVPGAVLAASTSRFTMDGAVGGAQIGYSWQAANIVYGLEADIQWSNQKGSTSFACPVPQLGQGCNELLAAGMDGLAPTTQFTQRLDWFGTFRGRFGTLATPDTLIYATGGFAYGRVETDGIMTGYGVNVVRTTSFNHASTQSGWTAGAGVESRFTGNWTARLEYLYVDLGTVSGSAIASNFPPLNFAYSSRITDNIVRLGVNYKFGEPGMTKN
jgi:outer membrane immunogenic protein